MEKQKSDQLAFIVSLVKHIDMLIDRCYVSEPRLERLRIELIEKHQWLISKYVIKS